MYVPPARATIEAQIIAKYEAELGTSVPILRRAFVRMFAKALSGVFWLLHHLIAWAMRQIFPQFQDAEYLAYLADWYNLPRKAATASILTATVAGTSGTILAAGTLVTYDGLVFTTRTAETLVDGAATVEIECLTAGTDGNLEAGSVLGFPTPLVGITSMTVASIAVDGEDQEALEDWRSRVWARMRTPPQGGASGDYIGWATEVSGIVTAFVKRIGTDVFVYPLAAKTGADRVPETDKIAEVQAYVQDTIRRPLCATVYAAATLERTVSATITDLAPADETTKANILSAYNKYVYAAYPQQYSDEANPTAKVSVGGLWAILNANGAIASAISLTVSGIGSGVPSYTLPIGEIAKPDGITWA